MLSQLFPKAFKKFLSLPLFGPVVEEWATWLEGQGYTWSTRRLMFRTLSRVDCHFSQRALHKLDELSQQDLDGCWKTFHRCRPTEAGTVRVLGRFLQARGLLRPALLPEPSRIDRRLHVYLEYLTDVRGFGASTLNSHQRTVREFLAFLDGPAGVFEQNVAFTVAAMRKEEENRVVRWAVVRGFHERTAAPSSEPRRQSRVQVVSLRAASMYL